MNDQNESDGFWESLDETIKEILAEVDLITTCGWEKQQVYHEGSRFHARRTGSTDRQYEVQVIPTGFSESHKAGIMRRPQEQEEYWSVSSTGWLRMAESRRMTLSHVGRINETSEGIEAPDGDCANCARSGAECMVYHEVGTRKGDTAGRACSHCRYRSLNCSFEAKQETKKNKNKNRKSRRKTGIRRREKSEQSKRTTAERKSPSNGKIAVQ